MKVAKAKGAPTRQATQAHRDAGSAPRRAARRRHVHQRRARRLFSCALDRLPGAAARQRRRVGARGRIAGTPERTGVVRMLVRGSPLWRVTFIGKWRGSGQR
jgi:hypothetical protein